MTIVKELILSSEPTLEQPDLSHGSVLFIGTATVLLRCGGLTILTDPNFLHQGDHIHLGYGIQSTRKTNPFLEIEELPPLDLIILSHLHDDHFDRIAAAKLDKNIPIITTDEATRDLEKKGFRALYPLETWDNLTITKGKTQLHFTAMPGRHGPGILTAMLPKMMGSLLEFKTESSTTEFRIYISGDTLVYDDLKEIPRRYPHINLGLLHLGGTQVLGVLLTMDAQQGIEAIKIISPDVTIPIHYNDYTVFKSPLEDFIAAVNLAGLEEKVRYLNPGETYNFTID